MNIFQGISMRGSFNFLAGTVSVLLVLVLFGVTPQAMGQGGYEAPVSGREDYNKRAQTGMKFMTVSINPRASAMGNATASMTFGSPSMFYNPAGMAYMDGFGELSLGTVQWLADIQHQQGGLALSPADGRFGVVGLFARTVDYGRVLGTIRADVQKGYIETDVLQPSAVVAGLSYARALTDAFSVGGNVKYVRQDLGASTISYEPGAPIGSRETQTNTVSTPSFDFGVRYEIGFRSLAIGMMARNFAPAVKFEEENFELPLMLEMGISMDVVDFMPALQEHHGLLVSVDAVTPRDYFEQIRVGGEYSFMDILFLRAGYVRPHDERGLSLGGGLQYSVGDLDFSGDYSYTSFGQFGNISRIALRIGY